MTELNNKKKTDKKTQNTQIDQLQCENFVLPSKSMNSSINETFYTCSIESLFLKETRTLKAY